MEKPKKSNTPPGPEPSQPPLRLRQVDIARLFGLTRQRISQMCADGWIPVSAGRIDPSAAARALIERERQGAQLKVLPEIRAQIRDIGAERDTATAALAAATARAAELEEGLNIAMGRAARVARDVINLEATIDVLMDQFSGLDTAFETALGQVMKLQLDELRADPELLELARLSPAPAPPSEHSAT